MAVLSLPVGLFAQGNFRLASGKESNWKIQGEYLCREDWRTLAMLIAERAGEFSYAYSVPTGGDILAAELNTLRTRGDDSLKCLLVDDVWSTGKSMELAEGDIPRKYELERWVVFARGKLPDNVKALFTFYDALNGKHVLAPNPFGTFVAGTKGKDYGIDPSIHS